MKTDLFDYDLPPEAIAQHPVVPRDTSKLMVVPRSGGDALHKQFKALPELLSPKDVLIVNDTKVMPARLFGSKWPTGGAVELLLLERRSADTWVCLVRPGRRLPPGTELVFGDGRLRAHIVDRAPDGGRFVRFYPRDGEADADDDGEQPQGDRVLGLIYAVGQMPLPPYITEPLEDASRYQTVYARHDGAKAAPTAGLHFTPALLAAVEQRGVTVATVTLHVGLGTFRPVQVDDVEAHVMHAEAYAIPTATVEAIEKARRAGGRVIAVGTTTVRALEGSADASGTVVAGEGTTSVFIYPGFTFKVVDGIITNFHLPRSSLLMMVSAFAGRETVLDAYREALQRGYRFFSFGDAMMIV